MIRLFLGKPGGGKSYGALCDIVDEIVNGNRVVVTNLSLDAGALSAWIQANHPEADFDPCTRLRLLSDAESKRFWLHRRPGFSLSPLTKEDELAGRWFKIPEDKMGVLYVIDECHIHFDARCWAENGLSLTYYNSQHRKFNDEVIFVTQFLDLVDKRVKGFGQDFVYFVNNGLQRFMTHFRLPSYFTVKTYQKPRTGNGQDSPGAVKRYKLDPTLAACYDTSAGVGIPGRKKVEVNRVKGLPIYWMIIPIAACCVLVWYAPNLITKGTIAVVDSGRSEDAGKQQTPAGVPQAQMGGTPQGTGTTQAVAPSVPVYVKSYAYRGNDCLVTLSDGRTLARGQGLLVLTSNFAISNTGERYPVYRVPPRAAAQAAAVSGP